MVDQTKSQVVFKVIRIHPLEIMNVCAKFDGSPSELLRYFILK